MTRRCFCLVLPLLAAWLLFPATIHAEEDLTVLKPADGSSPRKMLNNYLMDRCKEQFDARKATVKSLKTPEEVSKRQEMLKAKFIEAIGGFPEKTPLNAKVVGTVKGDGYTVEKVIYESRPNHHVTANFYIPEGKGPFPAVLIPCGHTADGKIGYQRVAAVLARNGFIALCYDPIGQGERYQILNDSAKPAAKSTDEHTLTHVGAVLVGRTTASYRIWDGIRSIDYLVSRPEVDAKRIGCTGSSGGGTLTSYLMSLDERIMAAAPSCYITSLEKLFATLGPQDGEQNITGQVAFGMEHADYLTMRIPRPTLILCASRDFFNIDGTWDTFREAKKVYGVAGYGERVEIFEYDTTHGYPKAQREAMLRFFRRWLMLKDDPVWEDEFQGIKGAELVCTRTGQVLEDLKGKSVFNLNAERALELAPARAKLRAQPDQLKKEVSRLIGLPPSVKIAEYKEVGDVSRDGYFLVKVLFETEPGIVVPGLLFSPKKEGPTPLVVYLHDQGKSAVVGAGGRCEELVKAGNRVLAIDLRGMGETAPSPPSAKPGQFGNSWRETFISLHLNRPLLGQRVHDLLAVVEFIDQKVGKHLTGIEVVGVGSYGPIALHAAALDPRIKKVTLDHSVISWSAVTRTPINYDQLSAVVPGALTAYDLPDLAALIAPRPLQILAPIDPAYKPLEQKGLDEAWQSAHTIYEKKNAGKQLILKAQ